jgi:hypothetical protein
MNSCQPIATCAFLLWNSKTNRLQIFLFRLQNIMYILRDYLAPAIGLINHGSKITKNYARPKLPLSRPVAVTPGKYFPDTNIRIHTH